MAAVLKVKKYKDKYYVCVNDKSSSLFLAYGHVTNGRARFFKTKEAAIKLILSLYRNIEILRLLPLMEPD